ncbi:discoidin domain-containing protein [Bacillus sp. S3]|uniref:discoidin domain-containing protein n=1 Tax=Bacillus sp. S3 TaxID=486398 RepID=UPI00118B0B45|nr:discoidin domain-containing protein [Bacillus sp. S3]QCJ42599.1 discoidin domain-containing protein [Bacillus sp. S3]
MSLFIDAISIFVFFSFWKKSGKELKGKLYFTDGDLLTRWGSQYKNISASEVDNQWIMVELDDSRKIDTVKLSWERARAEKYTLLASKDGNSFEEVYFYPETSGVSRSG